MKKTVLVFGLLSGAVSSTFMLLTIPFMDRIGFERSEVLGYTSIVASFLLVYFGVRSYRDRVAGGSISFGRALAVGALIALLSSVCYVATWQVIYYKVDPGFVDKYTAYTLDQARAAGASTEEIAQKARQMEEFKVLLQNPVLNAGITFVEPLPIGLLVALVSAAILRRPAPTAPNPQVTHA